MPTATLTSKGRITLPQAVRQALGLHAGTRIPVEAMDEATAIAASARATGVKLSA